MLSSRRSVSSRASTAGQKAGDSGAAIGAALYVYNTVLGNPRKWVMDQAYLGPSFSEESIRKVPSWLPPFPLPCSCR